MKLLYLHKASTGSDIKCPLMGATDRYDMFNIFLFPFHIKEDTSSSFDEDEESYTVVDEEMDSRTFHHPINRNSDYAERRYFGMETSLQLPNEPKPFPAYSHQKNSGGKASRYMYTNPSQQSVKDIRCHSTDAAQELHQELRSHQMKGYKHEYNEGVPQTTKAPAVNRGLKPEKLSFQVKAANIEKISFGKLNPADDISRHGGSAKGPMKSTRISKMQNSREIGFASHHQANEFFSRSSEQETEGAQSFCDRPQRPYIEQCGTRHEDHQWTPPFQKEEAIWGDTTQNTDYDECNWYVREYDRKKAEQILFQEKKLLLSLHHSPSAIDCEPYNNWIMADGTLAALGHSGFNNK
ncbi:uncharacterized protein clnk [Xenopus tropicalis]|uniref:Uncharacterized protein clnk n=1 Tax=Xenopus tropicalis TaxID=8364 RepID=A0A8J1JRB5_XENTR|nr:uncharacterized protein clnk [Xenopus tropicalis]